MSSLINDALTGIIDLGGFPLIIVEHVGEIDSPILPMVIGVDYLIPSDIEDEFDNPIWKIEVQESEMNDILDNLVQAAKESPMENIGSFGSFEISIRIENFTFQILGERNTSKELLNAIKFGLDNSNPKRDIVESAFDRINY